MPISANEDSTGFHWLHGELEPKQLYRAFTKGTGLKLELTMAGWERHHELKKTTAAESRIAFMAMKFGEADLNRATEECFRPAVARTGFELRVLTDQQGAGLIDDQLRAALPASRFIISDLSHGNLGAYWEAGYGEGLGRPVIYTCEKSAWDKNKSHFDTNHLVTVIWDLKDLKSAEDKLAATIRATPALRADAKLTDD